MYLYSRAKKIIELFRYKDSMHIDLISNLMNVSPRTIYNDIIKINFVFKNKQLEQIKQVKKNYSFIFNSEIEKLLEEKDIYFLSQDERITSIILKLFLTKIDYKTIEDDFKVTNKTISNDIKFINNNILKSNDLKITKNKILGKEIDKRKLFQEYSFKHEWIGNKFIYYELFDSIKEIIKIIEKENFYYTEEYINFLSTIISLMPKYLFLNKDNIEYSDLEKDEIKKSIYFKYSKRIIEVLKKHCPDIDYTNEDYYITTLLLSSKTIQPVQYKSELINEIVINTENIINKFEDKSLIILKNKDTLLKNLLNHIIPMYFRSKHSHYSLNPLLKEIKKNFSEIFKLVETIMEYFSMKMKINIPEDEIGFITLYFASQIKNQEKNKKLQVIIVCDAGLAISNILKTQILNLFDNIDVIDTLSQRELSSYNKEYDFAISTIPIDLSNKIRVNYLLSDYDKKSLKEKFNNVIDIKNMRGRKPMLKELITKNMIQLNMEASTWEEAIKVSSQKLLQEKFITENYVDSMIGNIKKYGNYTVLAPRTVIPHSRTEDGVLKLGMSLTVFKNDIDFKEVEKNNIRLFIVLAATDGGKHLKALQSLTKILSSEDIINEIINAPSNDAILNILKKYT